MIAGLEHGRLLVAPPPPPPPDGGGGGGGPPPPPPPPAPRPLPVLGFDGATYRDNQFKSYDSCQATLQMSVRADGLWVVSNGTSEIASGQWHNTPAAGVGNTYEVKITPTVVTTAGAVTNTAAGYGSLAANQSISMTKTRTTPGTSEATYSVQVEIRPAGGAVASQGTFRAELIATIGQLDDGGGGGGGVSSGDGGGGGGGGGSVLQ